jgi:glycosyltransferase involved in cell wall biosynthesis
VALPRVVLLRGYSANPWDLRPLALLRDRYDLSVLVTRRNEWEADRLGVPAVPVRALRDLLPKGRLANAAAYAASDRYLHADEHLQGAALVHAAELGSWFSAQAAQLKQRLGFRLAVTVWETLPQREAYRWPHERRYRRAVLDGADRFLAASQRARSGLLLEGVSEERISLAEPGIDEAHFAPRTEPAPEVPPLILSVGRLVWEKGHEDVIRALALLRRGGGPEARLAIVGTGPEEGRLRRYAAELGLDGAVELRGGVPYDAMPDLYARASCLVLASLQRPGWEEQFGMVLAEALAAGVPIAASTSGAIPEVAGPTAETFAPGDWPGLARVLTGMLRTPAPHVRRDLERTARFSSRAAAARLAAVYDELLSRP